MERILHLEIFNFNSHSSFSQEPPKVLSCLHLLRCLLIFASPANRLTCANF